MATQNKNHTPKLKQPAQLFDVTLRLEHLKNRDRPEEMLLSLYGYTKAYRKFIELVGQELEPDEFSVFQLERVTEGSVKLKNKVGYKPGVLSFIGLQLAKLLLNDASDDNIESKARELEKDTADFIESRSSKGEQTEIERREPYFDRVTLAEVMNDISDAGTLLMPKEHFEVINSEKNKKSAQVLQFNRSFRSSVSISELKKLKPEPYDGDDTVIALRPCNVGDSSWYVQSVVTERKYYAKITDSEWLIDYQSGKMPAVRANNLIEVNLKCSIVKGQNGSVRNVNAEITKVHRVKESNLLSDTQQANLFE
ncbi:hypothetical protein J4N45_01805 [Vibrio sp. SCSIO 43140]|uniref:hypothetical protein n=1 Tax=Vibrio sp. SCSIO 43140 TaxID=2819100 RepID=UPI00207644EF|nr:hypothetical protein [Vibrio sp. SCSIO 43140]USD60770.1 hypothetical protein J4N45_01805 [Vibrio sp. SCSIO 43140]